MAPSSVLIEYDMPVAKISGAGLGAIAVLVVVLWACIVGEHLIMQRANRDLSGALTRIRLLQKNRVGPLPVMLPTSGRTSHPAVG